MMRNLTFLFAVVSIFVWIRHYKKYQPPLVSIMVSSSVCNRSIETVVSLSSSSSSDTDTITATPPLPCTTTCIDSNNCISSSSNSTHHKNVILATTLIGDVAVAVTVTAFAAPFLTIIDKALVQRSAAAAMASSSATTTVWSSMYSSWSTMIQNPIKFIRSPTFLWMWGTYAATYTAANTLRTILPTTTTNNAPSNNINNNSHPHPHSTTTTLSNGSNNNNNIPQQSRPRPMETGGGGMFHPNSSTGSSYYYFSPTTSLLMGTSLVNSTASVMKDRAYAQLYGVTASVTKTTSNHTQPVIASVVVVPNITYALWLLRDLTVIGAAFVLPNHVAQFFITQQQQQQLHRHANTAATSTTTNKKRRFILSDATIVRLSQIGTPVVAQIVAGPLHFIGYDCYNYHNLQQQQHQSSSVSTRLLSNSHNKSVSLWSYQFWLERMYHLKSSFGQVITARMIRILPGYGIAGIWNTELLLQWKLNIVQPMIAKYSYSPDYNQYPTTTTTTTAAVHHNNCNENDIHPVWNHQQRH